MKNPLQQVRFSIGAILLLGAALATVVHQGLVVAAQASDGAAAQLKPETAAPNAEHEADELAIRSTADDFVKAFNAADAKAVGALWASDAEYTDESGQAFQGRAAIEKEYADLFKQYPGATMTVTIESIRFLGPDTAIEKGVAKVKSPKGDAETGARYTVVHAKRDGAWTMVVGRDDRYMPTSNEDYLKGLEWLIGDWTLDAQDRPLAIHFEWMAQKNFIKSTYTITKDGQATLTGGQIIGWNPKRERVVSWHFSADGGFGDDVWTNDGSKWVIEATGVFRDGSESASVNLLTPIDTNNFIWQSVNRTLNGVSLPNTQPVKIVRVQSSK